MKGGKFEIEWVAGITLIIVVACAVVGCGDGGSLTTHANNRGSKAHRRILSIGGPPANRPVEGFCGSADVRVGREPQTLEVTASCAPAQYTSYVGFTFTRFPARSPGRAREAHPGRVDKITSSGPESGEIRPRCRSIHGGVVCGVIAHRPFGLHAVIDAGAKGRCQLKAVVTTSFDDTCPDEHCIGVEKIYSLFSGRPKGC